MTLPDAIFLKRGFAGTRPNEIGPRRATRGSFVPPGVYWRVKMDMDDIDMEDGECCATCSCVFTRANPGARKQRRVWRYSL